MLESVNESIISRNSKSVLVCTHDGIENKVWGCGQNHLHPSSAPTACPPSGAPAYGSLLPLTVLTSSMFPAPSHSSSFPGSLLGEAGGISGPKSGEVPWQAGGSTHKPGTAPNSSSHEPAGSVPSGAGEGQEPHSQPGGHGGLGKGQGWEKQTAWPWPWLEADSSPLPEPRWED